MQARLHHQGHRTHWLEVMESLTLLTGVLFQAISACPCLADTVPHEPTKLPVYLGVPWDFLLMPQKARVLILTH